MAKNKGGEQTNGNTHKKYGIMVIQIMVIQIKKYDFTSTVANTAYVYL